MKRNPFEIVCCKNCKHCKIKKNYGNTLYECVKEKDLNIDGYELAMNKPCFYKKTFKTVKKS